jgi:putative tricarboxylic transport membrane protein
MGRTERIAASVVVATGLGVAWHSYSHLKLGAMISPGAGFLPFWVGVILVVLGTIWLVDSLLSRQGAPAGPAEPAPAETPNGNPVLARLIPGVLLVIAYGWIFERAGYFLATVLFMVGWQKGIEREGWVKTLVISLVCAGAMHLLFSFLLKGVLPTGAWFD